MATTTYDLIDSVVLSVDATTVTFSSIPQTYGDLILIGSNVNSDSAGGTTLRANLNGDANANYDDVWMLGDSIGDRSNKDLGNFYLRYSVAGGDLLQTSNATIQMQIFDYTSTSRYKACLMHRDDADFTFRLAGSWNNNTNGVTQIEIKSGIAAGAVFHLYGVVK